MSDLDADAYREQSAEAWDSVAEGWARHAGALARNTAPVSHWLVSAIGPQPGQRVLELAAGTGETGFMAAELLAPAGTLICSDGSEAMLEGARRRAQELRVAGVQFRRLNAEWIDLPLASLDAVLCRWGLMLLADPAAALRECRRVLRPGGRLALAVWAAPEQNPWAAVPASVLVGRGLADPPQADAPGMFALGNRDRLSSLLNDAGFIEHRIEYVDFHFSAPSFEAFWAQAAELAPGRSGTLAQLDHDARTALAEEVRTRLSSFLGKRGRIAVPARTVVAVAEA